MPQVKLSKHEVAKALLPMGLLSLVPGKSRTPGRASSSVHRFDTPLSKQDSVQSLIHLPCPEEREGES